MNTRKILCFFIFAFSLIAYSQVYANTALIGEIQRKYQETQTFQADFVQELYHKESQHTQKKSGIFSYKKESNIRFEATKPHEELLVINAKEIWNYIPDEEIAYKYNASLLANSNNIFSVITGKSALDKDFEVEFKEDVTINGKKAHFLLLYPLGPTLELVQAELYIDPRTKLIIQTKVFDFYGNTNTLTFSNIKTNIKLSSSLFSFTAPKGVDIEDNSKSSSFSIQNF